MHSHAERGNDRQTALIKAAFPETDDVELTDVEQGRRLPIGQLLIVPTLRVGTPPRTLRVPLQVVTRSVTGCIPTQSVGTIGFQISGSVAPPSTTSVCPVI